MPNHPFKQTIFTSMQDSIAQALKTKQSFAFVSMNIKSFKGINLRFGHTFGDIVLRQIETILEEELTTYESYYHAYADVFELLLHYDDAPSLQKRIYRIDDLIYRIEDKRIHQSIFLSFGIYIPQPNDAYQHMRTCANFCRSQSRDIDKLNTHVEVYQEVTKAAYIRKEELASALRKGFVQHDFHVVLQPKVSIHNSQIVAAEALLRWHDHTIDNISTQEIILLSEQNGFVRELDLYMFKQVCDMLKRWYCMYHQYPQISVNVSRYHFENPSFFDTYLAIFKTYEIPASTIEFEITESIMTQHEKALQEVVTQMHTHGFCIALDDFGKGAFSLMNLKHLPITTIKLDRSLFLQETKESRIIVKAILHLAQQLHIKTVCEGIETKEQEQFLRNYKADTLQTYLYYPPLPIEVFEDYFFSK